MRIAAGILMIISSLCLPALNHEILAMTSKAMGVSTFDLLAQSGSWAILLFFFLLPLVLTVAGGISTFRRKRWRGAVSGAICSVFIGFSMFLYGIIGYIPALMGILALTFVIKRKGEFQ